jgi:hypothetical protein
MRLDDRFSVTRQKHVARVADRLSDVLGVGATEAPLFELLAYGIVLNIGHQRVTDKPATAHVVSMKTEKAFIVLDALALFGLVNELLAPNEVRGLHYLVVTNVRLT